MKKLELQIHLFTVVNMSFGLRYALKVVLSVAALLKPTFMGMTALSWATLGIFCGAVGKSAHWRYIKRVFPPAAVGLPR